MEMLDVLKWLYFKLRFVIFRFLKLGLWMLVLWPFCFVCFVVELWTGSVYR
jgi:hypothetical protein